MRKTDPVEAKDNDSSRIGGDQAQAAMDRLRSRARKLNFAFDWETLKADRDADRP